MNGVRPRNPIYGLGRLARYGFIPGTLVLLADTYTTFAITDDKGYVDRNERFYVQKYRPYK